MHHEGLAPTFIHRRVNGALVIGLSDYETHTPMLRILTHTRQLVGELPYRDRLRDGTVGYKRVPILRFEVEGLPRAVDALLITSDLQGSGGPEATPVLPLEALVPLLGELAEAGLIPTLDRTVAVLAGDFWARLDSSKRGGMGDVRDAIRRVRDACLAMTVVLGNHDRVGDEPADLTAFGREKGIALAEGRKRDLHGITVHGVDGVIGDPLRRPFRRTHAEFLTAVRHAVRARPNIVLLHQGPARGTERRPEVTELRQACLAFQGGLVVYGHDYEIFGDQADPKARELCVLDVRDGLQFVNSTERVIVAVKAGLT